MRGKIAIVVLLTVALGAASFAWWWNYQRPARARAFWGTHAQTLRFAEKITAFQVQQPEEVRDLSGSPGLLNARTSLLVDESFDWSVPLESLETAKASWQYAITFHHESDTVTLWFDSQSDRMAVEQTGQVITLRPKTANGWKRWLAERVEGSGVRGQGGSQISDFRFQILNSALWLLKSDFLNLTS